MNNLLLFIGDLGSWKSILLLTVFYASASCWIFALFDVRRSMFRRGGEKLIWEQVVLGLPLIGAWVYLVVRQHRKVL